MKNTLLIFLVFCLIGNFAFAQTSSLTENTGQVKFTLFDSTTGEVLPFVNVFLTTDEGEKKAGCSTDFDGLCVVYNVPAGEYLVECKYAGYTASAVLLKVIVLAQQVVEYRIAMVPSGTDINTLQAIQYKVPTVDLDESVFRVSSCCSHSYYPRATSTYTPSRRDVRKARRKANRAVRKGECEGH